MNGAWIATYSQLTLVGLVVRRLPESPAQSDATLIDSKGSNCICGIAWTRALEQRSWFPVAIASHAENYKGDEDSSANYCKNRGYERAGRVWLRRT